MLQPALEEKFFSAAFNSLMPLPDAAETRTGVLYARFTNRAKFFFASGKSILFATTSAGRFVRSAL